MQSLKQIISEKLRLKRNIKVDNDNHYIDISKDIKIRDITVEPQKIIYLISLALRNLHMKLDDLISELSNYKDPDDLLDAYDRGELIYNKFEEELVSIILDDSKLTGYEGDIADYVYENAYDLFMELKTHSIYKK